MTISDSAGCDLRLFYLPRLFHTEEAQKTTLRAAIKHKLEKKPQKGCGSLHWIAKTARLVAEAVVRFDLRDDNKPLQDIIIFHEPNASDLHSSAAPSLEIMFNEASLSPTNEAPPHMQDRHRVHKWSRKHTLLELGIVLLQLGTHRDDVEDLPAPPIGPEAKQSYIRSHAEKAVNGVSEGFAGAVRNCAILFDHDDAAKEDEFLGRFLKMVLQPLRDCEKTLCTQGVLL
ncbi:uncharacterized protein BDZ83DRAFT_772781 [Colletotrichum acutatum]|uniref:Uncharacterized protein n=1 Tax=Glomerella acutata TaxID=27357 RepID=A0AAD8UAK0_GLOAC|nr:uncharacterized protein BDZ83DRAFT_772781 [Colletotrichum acutatum]KAK1703435.1 hypothetical protein BDZ83DRAFT_772781 [Colletotrichum acutatum]